MLDNVEIWRKTDQNNMPSVLSQETSNILIYDTFKSDSSIYPNTPKSFYPRLIALWLANRLALKPSFWYI